MAKQAVKKPAQVNASTSAEVERTYTFPETGVVVKAKNIDEATKAANKKAKEK